MTDIASTSREAIDGLRASGALTRLQQQIVDFMKKWRGPLTRQDLAHYMDIPLATICGRVRELLDMDPPKLEVAGETQKDHNGEKCVKRELLMLPSDQYDLFARAKRPAAIEEARA